MASITTTHASSYSFRNHSTRHFVQQQISTIILPIRNGNVQIGGGGGFRVWAAAEQGPSGKAAADVDTRIHWENDEEGWIGGDSGGSSEAGGQYRFNEEEEKKNLLGERFADLLNESSDSHYQFLGVSATSDLEEIKGAYRRLSKEYHPDTTSLPLKAASEKFMKLREVYNVLSDGEKRKFYDWTLAQEAASRKAEKMRMKMEDPHQEDLDKYVIVPDMVDRLDGKNMDLSDQAISALTFDIAIIIFSICCIVYVLVFKESY
uniref:Chaperone DnaJ-domain superfamily protein n=1 Tax=Pelargonium dichondrifolium TaxID=73194 RepID=A0A0F7CZA6_9ROSI